MIPVRLKMRNFMCYRDSVPALDFTGIHLACLSGDNGNGKSAIIDAMTWGLWGKARAASDDDLIYSSQNINEMEVEFEFMVGAQTYRVIRKRAKPKKRGAAGQSSLELQVKGEAGYRAVTGNTIALTQQKIIEVLHMDYDTFINSAYLRQGHADEFTRQAPAKRKEVLGNILGLEVYDALEAKARELVKRHETDAELLENTLREISTELARKPDFEAEMEIARKSLMEAEALAQTCDAALDNLRKQKEALEAKQSRHDELARRLQSAAADLKRWEEQAARHLGRVQQYEAVAGRRAEIEAGYAAYVEVKKAAEDLDRILRRHMTLDKQREQAERRIDQARNELLRQHAVVQSGLQELEKKSRALPELKNQLAQVQAGAGEFREAEARRDTQEQAALRAQAEISRIEAENARLERETGEAAEKLDLIARHGAAHTEARCPLCEQSLTLEALELITAKYTAEKQEKTRQLEQNRNALGPIRAAHAAALKEKTALENALQQEKTRLRSQEDLLKSRIKEIEDNGGRMAELKQSGGDIEQALARGDFAAAEQQALGAIAEEIKRLGYDAAAHDGLRAQLKAAEPYAHDKQRLDEAVRLLDQEKEAAAGAERNARALAAGLKEDGATHEALAAELAALPGIRREVGAAEAACKNADAQRAAAREALGSVRARLERLLELEKRKKEAEVQRGRAAAETDIYRELARAFGKNGVQALLIDAALPEIAEEANRILARLTDGRMTVKFETQRETKKGTVQETLDIAIADELGTRNYEMFSGGEAFRINFAVRIALSRLLAKRAGAPLPTLIIDEGFGTQDAAGMEKIKEAIRSIQDDFEKILVITHMDELKDAFPTRIDVVKGAEGSTISVN